MIAARAGAGGFLQTVTYGYPGLRVSRGGLAVRPQLPEGAALVRLRAIFWRGVAFDLVYDGVNASFSLSDAAAQARAADRRAAPGLLLSDATTGRVYALSTTPVAVPVGDALTITAAP